MTYLTDIIVDEAMSRFNISLSAALTLKYINRYVNASRLHCRADMRGVPYCYASKEKLAERIGKSKRTVARAIAELKAAGLIESRRTRGIAHIYITCYALDGTYRNSKNGTYNNNPYKSINNSDISIVQDKTPAEAPQMTANAADDAKIADASALIGAPAAELMQGRGRGDSKKGETPKKGKPTAKRRQRITKAAKEAAKAQYRQLLERKLDMTNCYWTLGDDAIEAEYRQRDSLIDLIAEAVSVKGRQIRVNGAGLTVEQYWQVVQNISAEAIEGLFDRLYTAEAIGGIANKRAYTLAAVYNAVQWDMMTQGATIPKEALYR